MFQMIYDTCLVIRLLAFILAVWMEYRISRQSRLLARRSQFNDVLRDGIYNAWSWLYN